MTVRNASAMNSLKKCILARSDRQCNGKSRIQGSSIGDFIVLSRRLPILLLLALAIHLTAPLLAQNRSAARERPKVVQNWKQRLQSIDELLKAQEHKKAKKKVNTLLEEMCNRIASGEGSAPILSMAVLLRAVAEAGLGNEHDATWDFHMARNLYPELGESDLSVYGETGDLLLRLLEGKTKNTDQEKADSKPREDQGDLEGSMIPPQKRYAPMPKYPFTQRIACLEGKIIIQLVIDENGKPRSPNILFSRYPVLAFAAIDAMREWRFNPASKNGQPVSAYYIVTVNFGLSSCT